MKRSILVLMALLMAFSGASWATTFYKYWQAPEESSGEVQLLKEGQSWNDVGGDSAVGTWEGDIEAYKFLIHVENFKQWDATSLYKIMENGTDIIKYINMGCSTQADTIRAHREASSGVHGATGTIVGTTDSQTLTNKTIDGDDNTLQDIAGSSIDEDACFPAVSFKPDNANDVFLFIDGTSTMISLQISDTAKAADKVLTVIADSVDFQDDGGNDIILSGIAGGNANNTAVTKGRVDSLASRVDDLERDDEFGVGAEVYLRMDRYGHWAALRYNMVSSADRDSLKRYEIFWSTGRLVLPDGTDSEKRQYLSQNANCIVAHYGEGNVRGISEPYALWGCVIAFDWVGTMVFSDVESVAGEIGGDDPRRDDVGEVIEVRRTIATSVFMAGAVSGNEAAAFTEFLQSDTSPKVKFRSPYVYHTEDDRLVMSFYGKTGVDAADHGYVELEVYDTSSEVNTATYLMDYDTGGYPSTPMRLTVDLTDGMTDAMLYELRVKVWSDVSHDTYVKQIVIEAVSEVGIE